MFSTSVYRLAKKYISLQCHMFQITIQLFYCLVSLDGSKQNCALETYPGGWAAAIAYTDGGINACGGRRNLGDAHRCWRFNGSTWSPLPNSTDGHCSDNTYNIVTQKGWWVIGDPGSCDFKKVNSEIFTGEKWIPGPAFPEGHILQTVRSYCLVNLSPTQTMLIGGHTGRYGRRETYIYDWNTENWSEAGSSVDRFSDFGCVNLGSQGVLAAGGGNGGYPDPNYSVNLYDAVQNSWSDKPDLPNPTRAFPFAPTFFNWDGKAIGLFTDVDQIYEWNKENGTWSVLEGVQLPQTYNGRFVKATQVPDDFVNSCNQDISGTCIRW